MASSITRDTWTNDSGTAAAPAGDGTIINNAALQNNIYARIDEMFAGAGGYTTLTFGGLISIAGFGVNTFSAGGSGDQAINLRNTSSGTGNTASVNIGNDAITNTCVLRVFSSAFTPVSYYDRANGLVMRGQGVGGLGLDASHGSGNIYFYSGSAVRAQLYPSGGFCVGTTPSDPGANTLATTGTLSVLGGAILFPATQIPSANVNTLDDYEEGTWTPSVGGSATYTTQVGTYTKIGRQVFVQLRLTINAIGTGSSTTISGLPFTAGDQCSVVVGFWSGLTGNRVSVGANTSGTTIVMTGIAAAGTGMTNADTIIGSGTFLIMSGSYYV